MHVFLRLCPCVGMLYVNVMGIFIYHMYVCVWPNKACFLISEVKVLIKVSFLLSFSFC